MARRARTGRWASLGAVATLVVLLAVPRVQADDEIVPSIAGLELLQAQKKLKDAGFTLGTVYELARERVLASYKLRVPIGFVFMQQPKPGVAWSTDKPVNVIVSAAEDGELPAGLRGLVPPPAKPPPTNPLPVPPPPPPPDAPRGVSPAAPGPGESSVPPPAIPRPPPPPLEPRRVPGDAPAAAPGSTSRGSDDPDAIGSPDAPRAAPTPDPRVVPSLTGLELVEAEQLVRDSEMTLYVERVPGHPIGRVLEQEPLARSARPAGGVVKIVVTAGGDFAAAVPQAPEVYLPAIAVPELLDRTPLQAGRIIGDLGLVMQQEKAKRGLAGRVVDQMPGVGSRLPKGGVVRVWIGPPLRGPQGEDDPNAPKPGPPTVPPTDPDGPREPAPAPGPAEPPVAPDVNPRDEPVPDAPAPDPGPDDANQPLAPGPLPGGAPVPIAPQHGTTIPRGEAVPIGFSWKGVKRASHYVLEVEEEGAQGRWLPSVRKPARKTAAILDIERLSTKSNARLRWRVRAVIDGRESSPSRWILLK